jgi:hypothetical protein
MTGASVRTTTSRTGFSVHDDEHSMYPNAHEEKHDVYSMRTTTSTTRSLQHPVSHPPSTRVSERFVRSTSTQDIVEHTILPPFFSLATVSEVLLVCPSSYSSPPLLLTHTVPTLTLPPLPPSPPGTLVSADSPARLSPCQYAAPNIILCATHPRSTADPFLPRLHT